MSRYPAVLCAIPTGSGHYFLKISEWLVFRIRTSASRDGSGVSFLCTTLTWFQNQVDNWPHELR